MSTQHNGEPRIRARQPKRKSGEIRFNLLLDALDTLLIDHNVQDVGIYLIAEQAGIPTASVYHFFPNKEAALLALAKKHHLALEQLAIELPATAPTSWQEMVSGKIERAAIYYNNHRSTLRLFYGAGMTTEIKSIDLSQTMMLADRRMALFEHYFHMPEIPDLRRSLALSIAIVDGVFGLSYSQHNSITPEFVREAQRASIAYLRTWLPEILPVAIRG